MSRSGSLPFRAPLEDYQKESDALFKALKSRDEAAEWRFKWMHPRFRGKSVADVKAATLDPADAQAVIAPEHGFENWPELVAFADAIRHEGPITTFETAVEAVISGDVATLRMMLREHPELARARSTRRHYATLLHYVAAQSS